VYYHSHASVGGEDGPGEKLGGNGGSGVGG